ncbi:MAG: PQQ-dependent sugar dehydrogenase [Solirubrobacterales bacterium]
MRRLAVAVGLIAALLALAAPAAAVELAPIEDYAEPLFVPSAPGDPGRLFVVEKDGRIRLTEQGQTSTFVDLDPVVRSSAREQGLLSMAFAPDYATTGRFYVYYTGNDSGNLHVDELIGSGDSADPGTRREVLTIDHSDEDNHNGGQLQFGPDGYLYVATGDGGGGGDPDENGQDTSTLLGKLLRIDPRQSGGQPYTVPVGNPFVGVAGADEIWSYGLRNPWRFSFDRQTGALTIGDVGQSSWEEINYDPPALGAGWRDNFGWDCREGLHSFEPAGCAGTTFTDPVHEYARVDGNCAVTGGYVSRDPGMTELAGRYVYADHCVGQIRSAALAVPSALGDRSEGLTVADVTTFGEDACGRLYVASLTGRVHRLVDGTPTVCTGTSDPGPPELTASARAKQKAKRLKVKLRSDQAVTVELEGEARLPDRGSASSSLTRRFRLKDKSIQLEAGVKRTVKPKFKRPQRSLRRIRGVLERSKRARRNSRVIAKVEAVGVGGKSPRERLKIRLKR